MYYLLQIGRYLRLRFRLDKGNYLIHTPEGPHGECRKLFDGTLRLTSPAAHYHFYLSAVISASEQIKEILKS